MARRIRVRRGTERAGGSVPNDPRHTDAGDSWAQRSAIHCSNARSSPTLCRNTSCTMRSSSGPIGLRAARRARASASISRAFARCASRSPVRVRGEVQLSMLPLCACGCGHQLPDSACPRRDRRFIQGHHAKLNPPKPRKDRKYVDGYVYVRCPDHSHATKDGFVAEHRMVLERKLGRFLSPDEHGHHINGVKDDNRPENLEALHITEHRRHHAANVSPDTRQKMSTGIRRAVAEGRINTATWLGKKRPDHSATMTGRKHTAESRAKMSAARSRWWKQHHADHATPPS